MPDTLKTQLVRLGSSNPELRKHIKPVLDKLNQGKLASTSFAKAAKDLYDLAFKSYRDPHVQDVMSGMETSIMRGLRTGNEVWVREEIHELKKMFPSGQIWVFIFVTLLFFLMGHLRSRRRVLPIKKFRA